MPEHVATTGSTTLSLNDKDRTLYSFQVSDEVWDLLQQLDRGDSRSIGETIIKGLVLLKVADDAKREGKRLAIVDADYEVEREITGF